MKYKGRRFSLALGVVASVAVIAVTTAPAFATQWTPAEMTTTLWLDAADASTIQTNDVAGKVSQWDDKSGNGYHATQSDPLLQPLTLTGTTRKLNGLNTVEGIKNNLLNAGSVTLDSSGDVAMYFVYQDDETATTGRETPIRVGTWSARSGTVLTYRPYVDGGPCSTGFKANGYPYIGPSVYSVVADYTASNSVACFVDGSDKGSVPYSSTKFEGVQDVYVTAGNVIPGQSMDGLLGEALIVQDTTVETRQLIEGYLAWKWGLEDNLPVDHPYKSAAPEIQGANGTVIYVQ